VVGPAHPGKSGPHPSGKTPGKSGPSPLSSLGGIDVPLAPLSIKYRHGRREGGGIDSRSTPPSSSPQQDPRQNAAPHPTPGGYPPPAVLTSCTPPYLYLLSGHHGGCPSILCEQGGWRASPIFPKAGFGDGLASATEKGPISFRPREVIGPAHPFSKTPGKGGPHLLQQDPRQTGFRVSLQQDSRVLVCCPINNWH
jgi:hypothetical protein